MFSNPSYYRITKVANNNPWNPCTHKYLYEKIDIIIVNSRYNGVKEMGKSKLPKVGKEYKVLETVIRVYEKEPLKRNLVFKTKDFEIEKEIDTIIV